ncbi:hypothetical protein [Rhizobium sp. WYCCWR 11146]|uniref:hypothetical protein n=1 Tax=Rhizobium sp. WYCCWR 11146 TaxID=2749833 RepID=UPI0015E7280E|nr:hypothetical protein [Rhizobium sp. WYCCWR 11146]MBA1347231.1 hypothetical protein [Rhizobium sp. WYCCWR 11146]
MIAPHPIEVTANAAQFVPPGGGVLIHGTLEERSLIPDGWRAVPGLVFVEIFENDHLSSFRVGSPSGSEITLRRRDALENFLDRFHGRELLIDYTGLSHHVWMPLLKVGLESGFEIRLIYSEPGAYQFVSNPRLSDFFDLSEKVRGITPIPTFSKLSAPRKKAPVLVPLLGFEGTRFKHVIETLQPEGQDIFPIVGIPGFQLDFPFHSYRGNADALSFNRAWENVRFSDAACPFSLYATLSEIKNARADDFLQISPIGTKPHALGAALFAILNPETELVYDHPVRKKQRSAGAGRCHIYNVSEFVRSRRAP